MMLKLILMRCLFIGHCFVWKSGPDDTSVFEALQKIKAHKTYILKVLFSPVCDIFFFSFLFYFLSHILTVLCYRMLNC